MTGCRTLLLLWRGRCRHVRIQVQQSVWRKKGIMFIQELTTRNGFRAVFTILTKAETCVFHRSYLYPCLKRRIRGPIFRPKSISMQLRARNTNFYFWQKAVVLQTRLSFIRKPNLCLMRSDERPVGKDGIYQWSTSP